MADRIPRVLCLAYGNGRRDRAAVARALAAAARSGAQLTIATPQPPPVADSRRQGCSISDDQWQALMGEHSAAVLEQVAELLARWGGGARLTVLEGHDSAAVADHVRERGYDTVVLPVRTTRWSRLARTLRRSTNARVIAAGARRDLPLPPPTTSTAAPTGVWPDRP